MMEARNKGSGEPMERVISQRAGNRANANVKNSASSWDFTYFFISLLKKSMARMELATVTTSIEYE